MEYDVFISYSRVDDVDGAVTALRDGIEQDFERYGVRPRIFFDVETIRSMDDWETRTLGALRSSRVLLVCLTPAFLRSGYCRKEWEEYARRRARLAAAGDAVAAVYCVDVDGVERPDDERAERWRDEVAAVQLTDVRPWFPQGREAFRSEVVRARVEELGERLWDRLRSAQVAADVPGNLRRSTPYFVGRSRELRELRSRVAGHRVGVVSAVHGLGGVGKTELATTYAHDYRDHYPGGTWLVPCEGVVDLASAVAGLAFELGLRLPEDAPVEARARAVVEELRRLAHPEDDRGFGDQAALVVLDNVSERTLLAPRSLGVLPGETWLHVIATTRLGLADLPWAADEEPSGLGFVAVDALPLEDALELVRERQPRRDDGEPGFADAAAEQEARDLVALLGGYTLAVEQAAVVLGFDAELRPGDLLALLRSEGLVGLDALSVEAGGDAASLHERGLTGAILDQSLGRLSPRALRAVEYAALMPADGFAWSWLEQLTAIDGLADERWPPVQRMLEGRRLVVGAASPGLARMHRLVGAHVARTLGGERHGTLDGWLVELLPEHARTGVVNEEVVNAVVELAVLRSDSGEVARVALWFLGVLPGRTPLDLQSRLANVVLAALRRVEEGAFGLSRQARDLAVALGRVGDVARAWGDLVAAEAAYVEGLTLRRALVARDPGNTVWIRDLSVSLGRVGDVARARGDLVAAEAAYVEGLGMARELVARDLGNTVWIRDLSVSLDRVGDVARARGDLVAAEAAYVEGLGMARGLVARDLGNTEWIRDLSVSLDRVGDVARARGDLVAAEAAYVEGLTSRRALAARDLSNTVWIRDLSVSLGRVGDVARARGDLVAAEAAYVEGLTLKRALVARDPGNTVWIRDLSVSLDRVGDVARARGDLVAAEAAYVEGLGMARGLVARDLGNTEWIRDLSVSLDRVGDVARARGDLVAAEAAYVEGLGMARGLVARDPGNTEWIRDLSVSLTKVGDVARARGDLVAAEAAYFECLSANRGLSARDPGNTEWVGDVSVSLERMGDVARARGDLVAAEAAYVEGLQMRRGLAARDPGNTDWVRDLSVSVGRVGDMARARGDLVAAEAAYVEGLGVVRALAARDPGHAGWSRDVVVLSVRMANLDTLGDSDRRAYLDEARTILERLHAAGVLHPGDLGLLEALRREVDERD